MLEGDVEIVVVLKHWNNDFFSGSDEKQPLRAGQVEIMERWIGVNLDRKGLASLCRRKSRYLLGVEPLKSRLFVHTFCGSDRGGLIRDKQM